MFARLFGRTRSHAVPQELYGSVVAQARNPVLFGEGGFNDDVTGRFDALALHMFMFSRRLVREDTPLTTSLNQEVFDLFTDDTDRALRELGVGDTSVPKKKKKLVRSFYALVEDFSSPLDDGDKDELITAIESRFGQVKTGFASDNLATYMREVANALDMIPAEQILSGKLNWPEPEKFFGQSA